MKNWITVQVDILYWMIPQSFLWFYLLERVRNLFTACLLERVIFCLLPRPCGPTSMWSPLPLLHRNWSHDPDILPSDHPVQFAVLCCAFSLKPFSFARDTLTPQHTCLLCISDSRSHFWLTPCSSLVQKAFLILLSPDTLSLCPCLPPQGLSTLIVASSTLSILS